MQEMRIYLLNNTKPYREGEEEYSGAWFNCPVDFEEVREKIGVEHEEQIEIADYELPFLTCTAICHSGKSTPTAAWCWNWRVRLSAMK